MASKSKSKQFVVEVYELHYQPYVVTATSPERALAKYLEEGGREIGATHRISSHFEGHDQPLALSEPELDGLGVSCDNDGAGWVRVPGIRDVRPLRED